jgi:hypothetical protein
METIVRNDHAYTLELRSQAELSAVPVHVETVTGDISELIEESYIRGVLSEAFPAEPERLEATVTPLCSHEPLVDKVQVRLEAGLNGQQVEYTCDFPAGRWVRSAQLAALRLREEGTLSDDQSAYRALLAVKDPQPTPLEVPPLQPPPVFEQTLEDFGVRELIPGSLTPDRPLLVNQRLAADMVRLCEEADTTETGGAVLGKILRLPEPLPGSNTRIVTIFSATVEDTRHEGAPLSIRFSPQALAEAAKFADLRGFGETVQTVFHTHGWSKSCGKCNQNPKCPLAECRHVSVQDYQLLESLFSSKATLMPIAGRRLGEEGKRPVLEIHAWRGGEMRPIRWQEYRD